MHASANGVTEARRAPVGPRDGSERALRNIWSELLGHRRFGVHDNFFDVGGSSLEAVRLQDRIRARFGYELSLGALLATPTIAEIALLLRGAAAEEPTALVPLKPAGTKPPVFCFHPLGGSVASYAPLAHALGNSQPVYGLQALGLSLGRPPQRSVEELVGTYAEAILSVRPDGPHRLLGYSLGGALAFACAHALRDVPGGQPLVVLLDTQTRVQKDDLLPYRAVGSYALHLELDYERIAKLGRDQALATIHEEGVRRGVLAPDFPLERLAGIFDTAQANALAVASYELRPYPGEVVVFAAGEPSESDLGWREYGASVTSYALHLPHTLMLEEKGVRRIAELLVPHLDDVTARGRR